MHRGVHGGFRGFALDALDDDGIVAHGATDETLLPREGRCCPLAHDPKVATIVGFPPGVVVMVVDGIHDFAANDLADALHDPFTPRIGIAPRKLHGGDVASPQFAILIDDGRRHVHAVFPASGLEIARCAHMPEPTTAEVDTDPDKTVLVG